MLVISKTRLTACQHIIERALGLTLEWLDDRYLPRSLKYEDVHQREILGITSIDAPKLSLY